MTNEQALAPYTNGTRSIVASAELRPVLISASAEARILEWSRSQAIRSAHESGHCCVAALVSPQVAITSVTIKGSGTAGWAGRVETTEGEDTEAEFDTPSRLRSLIAVGLGGLESERALFSEPTSGCLGDLEKTAKLANELVSGWASDEHRLTPLNLLRYEIDPPPSLVAERFEMVEDELRRGRQTARDLIAAHKDQVLEFAKLLFQSRRFDGAAVDAALALVGLPVPERRP